MKCRIGHFYGSRDTPPVPESYLVWEGDKSYWEVEVDDLFAFAEKHGSIQLSPPDFPPFRGHWFIWVTDGGKFTQR